MGRGRLATRHNHRDHNEPELVAIAEKCGAKWIEAGPLDGWIIHRGQHIPVEIKGAHREGHADEFKSSQLEFIRLCELLGAPFLIWRTADDVIRDLAGASLMLAPALLYLCRMELGKEPRIYSVHPEAALVVNPVHKTIRAHRIEPGAWIAYPRNPHLSRTTAVGTDYTPEGAMRRARRLFARIRR